MRTNTSSHELQTLEWCIILAPSYGTKTQTMNHEMFRLESKEYSQVVSTAKWRRNFHHGLAVWRKFVWRLVSLNTLKEQKIKQAWERWESDFSSHNWAMPLIFGFTSFLTHALFRNFETKRFTILLEDYPRWEDKRHKGSEPAPEMRQTQVKDAFSSQIGIKEWPKSLVYFAASCWTSNF